MSKQTITLVRGLPGSGKSTWAKAQAALSPIAKVVEADDFFVDKSTGVYSYQPALIEQAHKTCQAMTLEAIRYGYGVFVANTFTKRWEMEPYFKMAEEHKLLLRVVTCRGDYQNVHGVPQGVVEAMRKRWEEIPVTEVDYGQ